MPDHVWNGSYDTYMVLSTQTATHKDLENGCVSLQIYFVLIKVLSCTLIFTFKYLQLPERDTQKYENLSINLVLEKLESVEIQ